MYNSKYSMYITRTILCITDVLLVILYIIDVLFVVIYVKQKLFISSMRSVGVKIWRRFCDMLSRHPDTESTDI